MVAQFLVLMQMSIVGYAFDDCIDDSDCEGIINCSPRGFCGGGGAICQPGGPSCAGGLACGANVDAAGFVCGGLGANVGFVLVVQ